MMETHKEVVHKKVHLSKYRVIGNSRIEYHMIHTLPTKVQKEEARQKNRHGHNLTPCINLYQILKHLGLPMIKDTILLYVISLTGRSLLQVCLPLKVQHFGPQQINNKEQIVRMGCPFKQTLSMVILLTKELVIKCYKSKTPFHKNLYFQHKTTWILGNRCKIQ